MTEAGMVPLVIGFILGVLVGLAFAELSRT